MRSLNILAHNDLHNWRYRCARGQPDARLEALSDKVRKGEPIGMVEALEVIAYQEKIRATMIWENTPEMKIRFSADDSLPHKYEITVEAGGFDRWGGCDIAGDSPEEALGLLLIEIAKHAIPRNR